MRTPRAATRFLVAAVASTALGQGTVTVGDGDRGPGISLSLWGHYFQTGGKFGSEDIDERILAPGTAAQAEACVQNCAVIPYLGAQIPEGCTHQERWSFRYWRRDLFAGIQVLRLDPDDVTGSACGGCTGSPADVVECQMKHVPYNDEGGADLDSQGNPIPGTGYTPGTYHVALAGILAEGLTAYVALRSPVREARFGSCALPDLRCVSPDCLSQIATLTQGLYEYVRRNSAGQECEPSCDLPRDALDRIIWGYTFEPDLGTGLGFFGPHGFGAYGEQLDTMLAVQYPAGHVRRVAAPDLTSGTALDDPKGVRAAWLGTVRNKVDFVTYHGLYCGMGRTYQDQFELPSRLRAELGTAQPLWCTEWANNELFPRSGPCGGSGCGGSAPPDCGANRLDDGMLDESAALLYQTKSNAGLVGSLFLGLMEGHGVPCGGAVGTGLVGNATRDLDGQTGKELFIQNPSISYHAFRMILRELGDRGEPGSHVLATSSNDVALVEAARRHADGSIALCIVNRGGPRSGLVVDLSGLTLAYPARLIQRVVAPAHLDGSGNAAPLQDVVQREETLSGPATALSLEGKSVTSIRIGPADLVPRIDSVVPPGAPVCSLGQVKVTGRGIGNGDEVLIGAEKAALSGCAGSPVVCDLVVPFHDLPVGMGAEIVEMRVVSSRNGAVSEPAGFAHVAAPTLDCIDATASTLAPGGLVRIAGKGLSNARSVAIFEAGGCQACTGGLPDRVLNPLCVATLPSVCGTGSSESVSFLLPAVMASHVTLQVACEPAPGVTAWSNCLPIVVDPWAPSPASFCITGANPECRIPATTLAGTSATFRVLSPLGGYRYEWDLGDGTTATSSATTVSHAYALPGGGRTVTLTAWPLQGGCGLARSVADAVFVAASPDPQIVVGPGPGSDNPARLRAYHYDGSATLPALLDLAVYGGPSRGLNVAWGAIGAGPPSILTGPGPGPTLGPHVRAFSPVAGGTPIPKVSFYAYGTPRYGVRVASGDVDADGFAEILTAAPAGAVFGPHVRGFDFDGVKLCVLARCSFFAFATLAYGADAASGDLDGDAYDEILASPGPSAAFAANVRGFQYDGSAVGPSPVNFVAEPSFYGIRIACAQADGLEQDEILTAPGPSPVATGRLRVWHRRYGDVSQMLEIGAFLRPYGATVGPGSTLPTGSDSLLAGEGPDPAATSRLRGFEVSTTLEPIPDLGVDAFAGLVVHYGVNVAGQGLE